jgi:hypothetical protein
MKAETFEEAFQSLADAAYHGELKAGSRQWDDLRKFFFAGAIWFTEQCRARKDINSLISEMQRFYEEMGVNAELARKVREDIERSGR